MQVWKDKKSTMTLAINLAHALLHPLSIIRRKLYHYGILKSYTLPGTVISVGNITTGGTGKTPVVISLAQLLQSLGYRVAILTRGYLSGLKKSEGLLLCGENLKVLRGSPKFQKIHADEAAMQSHLLKNIPVIVGSLRHKNARAYLEQTNETPDFWLLDDGFQHLKIKRDFDFLLFDANDPFNHSKDLPLFSQLLREPVSSIQYADAIFATRWTTNSLDTILPKKLKEQGIPYIKIPFVYNFAHNSSDNRIHEKGRYLLAAAIAFPERLLKVLAQKNIIPEAKLFLGDHQLFDQGLLLKASQNLDGIITTEKDYWRNPDVFKPFSANLYCMKVESALPKDEILTLLRII